MSRQRGVKVYLPRHARTRARQRGGDPVTLCAGVRQAAQEPLAQQVLAGDRPRRLAVDNHLVPEVVPIVEFRPPKGNRGPEAAVITVLPFDADHGREVIHV